MPGQFINTGTNPNGKLSLTNVNNQGSLVIAQSPPTYTIGQSALGGIIAYIFQSGDPGYDANIQHGLVAASSDQSAGIRWYNGSYTTAPSGTALGTGLSNTDSIIASQGEIATSYAAGLARAYNGGGYTDWYLPSEQELGKLCINQSYIGGFSNSLYWSSSEYQYDNNFAWQNNFSNCGSVFVSNKNTLNLVRAIRSF